MLTKLLIKNIALIDRADVEFGPRLNVLSGETGSGKSVMLDSINFVLGAKADKSMIRYGEEECSVQAVFAVDKDAAALAALRELDIDADEEIIISRKFRRDGRGDIRLNGNAVNATMLRKVTSLLVDVHGQSEHFYLLNEANQLKLIDKAAGEEAEKLKNRLGDLLDENRTLRAKRKALGGDEAERGRRLDILRFQLDEIDRAELKDGEEEQLKERKNFFANIEKILRGLAEAREFLQGDNAALDCLNSAKRWERLLPSGKIMPSLPIGWRHYRSRRTISERQFPPSAMTSILTRMRRKKWKTASILSVHSKKSTENRLPTYLPSETRSPKNTNFCPTATRNPQGFRRRRKKILQKSIRHAENFPIFANPLRNVFARRCAQSFALFISKALNFVRSSMRFPPKTPPARRRTGWTRCAFSFPPMRENRSRSWERSSAAAK